MIANKIFFLLLDKILVRVKHIISSKGFKIITSPLSLLKGHGESSIII